MEGKRIDVGSGVLVTVREVVTELARIIGSLAEPTFGVLPDRPMKQEPAADVARAVALLGWRCSTPLEPA